MEKSDTQKKIEENEDYIKAPKYSNSLNSFISKQENADGVENNIIAKLLSLSEEEVEKTYQEAIEIIRNGMEDDL